MPRTSVLPPAKHKLTPRMERFCAFFTSIGGDGFGDQTKAGKLAGYNGDNISVTTSQLLKLPKIRERLQDYYNASLSAALLTPAKILAELDNIKRVSLENGNQATAARCVELQGRYLAMFSDRVTVDVDEMESFSIREAEHGRRLARALVKEMIDVSHEGQKVNVQKALPPKVPPSKIS